MANGIFFTKEFWPTVGGIGEHSHQMAKHGRLSTAGELITGGAHTARRGDHRGCHREPLDMTDVGFVEQDQHCSRRDGVNCVTPAPAASHICELVAEMQGWTSHKSFRVSA